jgi:hypothetical protein
VNDFDADGDGLSEGTLQVPEGSAYPDILAVFSCDNCPDISNPTQDDVDCDDVGDLCDNCLDLANHDQANGEEQRALGEHVVRGVVGARRGGGRVCVGVSVGARNQPV